MSRKHVTAALVMAAMAVGGCATEPTERSDIVKTPAMCKDITIPVYFDANDAAVTPEGRKLIATEANHAKACTVDSVEVLGLAEAVGDPAANLELSKKRAASVAEAIKAAGLPDAKFELEAAGRAGAVTPEGEARPLRRRADVTLHLSNPK